MTKDCQSSHTVVPPGATIGILGSGQLGKMMAVAAKEMGYRVHVFSPDKDTPAGQVADIEIQASYTDLAAIEQFAKAVDVVTLEFENIPADALKVAGEHAPVQPNVKPLWTTQNRSREKTFLRDLGIPTARFQTVHSLEELKSACEQIMPGVVKTTENGYDGKGQAFIRDVADIEDAWSRLNCGEAILEELIDFDYEFSVVAARNGSGEVAAYPSIRNEHANHILEVSISPSGISSAAETRSIEIIESIMNELGYVGICCVEFFYRDGEVLVNEIAPRPHNSGHITIEGHVTSQFEQHVRAVCGLPLGSTEQIKPIALANLLGDHWESGPPAWQHALAMANVKLHLYGKEQARVGRKMGHLTATADTTDEARTQVLAARASLSPASVG
jgi:5-(carboxyamino)imidazole ribonucleotide synthase